MVEMRDRGKDWQGVSLSPDAVTKAVEPTVDALKDAISALVALGYKPQEASRMVNAVESEGLASEAVIRLALRAMVQ